MASSSLTAFDPGLSLQLSAIKILSGTNYEDWKESLKVNLAIMNLDLAIREEEPPKPTAKSYAEEKAYHERWEHFNRTCLMIMKYTMDKSIEQSVPDNENAKAYLADIGKQFTKFDKAEKATYMQLLTSTKYDGFSSVREHIMKLTHYFNKLKDMKVELVEDFLVWQIMKSLSTQFDGIKSAYNSQKGEWSLSDMTAIVTQEEARAKMDKPESAFIVTNDGGSHKKKNFKPGNNSKPNFKKKPY
ncbi:hypothetical protein Vadar_026323 [Vaccinium darrowii]|uniref:Uncharacterized protein n=1 Tax=Vaccinium darrowii TaxID=229202 RepID=A0ACB7Z7V2_9ERIC|nr:hypothetical protein Vadar_026899 [Vaccinium darrowii]KAH7861453.1 hypothetical protein Vadar_026323 [Vaccinium darrowii]